MVSALRVLVSQAVLALAQIQLVFEISLVFQTLPQWFIPQENQLSHPPDLFMASGTNAEGLCFQHVRIHVNVPSKWLKKHENLIHGGCFPGAHSG